MKPDVEPEMLKSVAPDMIIDAELECKVNASLHGNIRLHSEAISAHVQDRRVYLEGSVPVEGERDLARQTVEGIFGIRSVYNNLTFPSRLCQSH